MQKTAEYIWLDGYKPLPNLRSKTKIVNSKKDITSWGFDGSSTEQAAGDESDCILTPRFVCKDPMRPSGYLAFCDVYKSDQTPHPSNTRVKAVETYQPWQHSYVFVGFEQEYTLMKEDIPLAFNVSEKSKPTKQGEYYCGVGNSRAIGREIAEEHMQLCLKAGLSLSGINAEVMPGQWEFQIGPCDPIVGSDQLWLARYLLLRVAEKYDVDVSFNPKPLSGDWNGAGCHTNFSTTNMRKSWQFIENAIDALSQNPLAQLIEYGSNYEARLSGAHETAHWSQFSWGVGNRTASVRVPLHVKQKGKGYIEDRRPNANCDPYRVVKTLIGTICPNEY